MNRHLFIAACVVTMSLPRAAAAQGQPTMYGPSIAADQAKTIAAAAVAEARKNQWTMAIAIVDTAGDLVYFERMNDTCAPRRWQQRRWSWLGRRRSMVRT